MPYALCISLCICWVFWYHTYIRSPTHTCNTHQAILGESPNLSIKDFFKPIAPETFFLSHTQLSSLGRVIWAELKFYAMFGGLRRCPMAGKLEGNVTEHMALGLGPALIRNVLIFYLGKPWIFQIWMQCKTPIVSWFKKYFWVSNSVCFSSNFMWALHIWNTLLRFKINKIFWGYVQNVMLPPFTFSWNNITVF